MELLTKEKEQLELRKWALEISLRHADSLFPQRKNKLPSELLSNAHKIIALVTSDWDKPIEDPIENDVPTFESNP